MLVDLEDQGRPHADLLVERDSTGGVGGVDAEGDRRATQVAVVHERATQQQLREFLKQRFLDADTHRALAGVLEIYGQIEAHRRRLAEIERERGAIYKQQQIQGSLAPLGREGDEGALRTRYVATLGQLEDRIAALDAEESRLNAEIARLEEEAKRRLGELTKQ